MILFASRPFPSPFPRTYTPFSPSPPDPSLQGAGARSRKRGSWLVSPFGLGFMPMSWAAWCPHQASGLRDSIVRLDVAAQYSPARVRTGIPPVLTLTS